MYIVGIIAIVVKSLEAVTNGLLTSSSNAYLAKVIGYTVTSSTSFAGDNAASNAFIGSVMICSLLIKKTHLVDGLSGI